MTETKNNFIAGEWLAGDNSIENRNPSDLSDIIGHFAQASSTQLDKALDAARAAQKIWAATGLEARQTVLMNIGNELMERSAELGTLLSREEEKTSGRGQGRDLPCRPVLHLLCRRNITPDWRHRRQRAPQHRD